MTGPAAPGGAREAAGVDRALYIPRGNVLLAAAGKVWLFGDDVLFRRKGRKFPIAKATRIRSIERVHGDWFDVRHFYVRTPEDYFDLVPTQGGGDLEPFMTALARQAGIAIAEREVDSVLLGHLNRTWERGAAGKLLVGFEIFLFVALVAFAYAHA